MNYRISVIVLMLMCCELLAGKTTIIKKDDEVYKKLQMTVEQKQSVSDRNKISVTLKMKSGKVTIFLSKSNKTTALTPTIKGQFAHFNFDIDKNSVSESDLSWPNRFSKVKCSPTFKLKLKDIILAN